MKAPLSLPARLLSLLFLVSLLCLSACAPPRLAPGPKVPLAAATAAGHEEGAFVGAGGVRLYEQWWRPAGSPRAVVVLVHGLKDHSARYSAFAERLVGRGYAVHALDLRGHGMSLGERAFVNSFDEYLDDLDVFLDRVRQREPGKAIFLFGHSMGGAIVTLYALAHPTEIKGLVLSGAALKVGSDVSGFLVGATKIIADIGPDLPVMELADDAFSRDPAAVRDMVNDPLILHIKGPARTAEQVLSAIDRIQGSMESLTVPVLILHGTADRLTNPEGSQELAQRAKSSDKTLKLYPGLYHDLLHEPEKETVEGDIVGWIDARAPVMDGQTYSVRLKDLERRVDELKEKVYRGKPR